MSDDYLMRIDRDALWWMLPGALAALVVLSILSIGIFVAPIAGLAALQAARATSGRGSYGTLVGAGILIAGICLPQPPFRGIGLFGLALLAAGMMLCVAAHRTAR